MQAVKEATYTDLERYLDGPTRMLVDHLRDLYVINGYKGIPTRGAPALEMAEALRRLGFEPQADDVEMAVARYRWLMDYTPERG